MRLPRVGLAWVLLLGAVAAAVLGASADVRAAERAGDPVPWGVEAVYNVSSLERTSGGDGVDVAVLDTGVDDTHPDLRDRVERCRNYTSESVRKGSCNDVDGHGTHVAGTVAADGGPDGEGLWGLAPAADIWAFKVCTDDGSCRTDRIGKAIKDAADLGAEIVVLSLGGEPEPFVQDALRKSLQQDVLPVAAAGNSGPDLSTINYPAADELAVSVGALGRLERGEGHDLDNLVVPDFSSRGAPADAFEERDNLTELAAPGFGVRSTATGGGYSTLSGTSMAAPHVAGLAALLWDARGDVDGDGKVRDDVREVLRERAATADITQGRHASQGYDPAAGVGMPRLDGLTAWIHGPTDPVVVGETVTLEALVTGPYPVASLSWTFGNETATSEGRTLNRTLREAGFHEVTLRVTDANGAEATARFQVHAHHLPVADVRATPDVPLAGEPVTLDGTVSWDPDGGDITAYDWDIDGDLVADQSGPVVEVVVPEPGPTPVTLAVTDDEGAINASHGELLVNDRPRVRIEVPDGIVAGEPAELRARIDDSYGIVDVRWTFPDGGQAQGLTVRRPFPAGSHDVSVLARDEHGATGTANATITVAESGFGPAPAPGAGSLAAVAALLAAGWVRRRGG